MVFNCDQVTACCSFDAILHFRKNTPISGSACIPQPSHPQSMLTEIYIEALLVDEEMADLVWEAWDMGVTNDWVM